MIVQSAGIRSTIKSTGGVNNTCTTLIEGQVPSGELAVDIRR